MTSHLPTDIEAEFYVNGAWNSSISGNDFSSRVRGSQGEGAISITRGVADYQSGTSAHTASFTLNNRDGLFTDDNPLSPLYGKFGQNTRARLGVKSGGTWQEYLRLPDYGDDSGQYASTVDKASLDITGDIDIRIEFSPAYTRNKEMVLISKSGFAGNFSWAVLWEKDGSIRLITSPDGSATVINTTVPKFNENTTHTAVRVTLDVDNGAGGRAYTYYSAPTIAGPWHAYASGTIAGTTSIFSGSGNLEIGSGNNGSSVFTGDVSVLIGKVYAAEVYSGIAGTLVADFKPNGKGLEATTWADTCASPNTWTVNGTYARLASDRVRISGELVTTPVNWDKTGRDVTVPVTLAGLLSRYSANKGTLAGCIYHYYRINPNLTDYWPCEDPVGSTQVGSAVTGGRAGKIFDCSFDTPTGIAGATGCLTLNTALSSYAKFLVGQNGANTGSTTCVFYMKLSGLPASGTTFATVYIGNGTVRQWRVGVSSTSFIFTLVDEFGSTVASSTVLFGTGASPLNQWVAMSLRLNQEGGNVRWETAWHAVGSITFYTHLGGGSTFAGTCGQFARINFLLGDAAMAGAQICHVVLTHGDDVINTSEFANSSAGFNGETFGRRALRLCGQEGVYLQWRGNLDDTQQLGPQPVDTLYGILTSGLKVAGGILTDARDIIGFEIITQRYLGNRRGLELDYSASPLAEAPLPVNDLRFLVNDFTATRQDGASARYVADSTVRKNTADPPTGVGRWEKRDSYAAYSDDQMNLVASREVFLGTWEERRIPNLVIALHRSEVFNDATVFDRTISADLGDPINLTGLSASPLPPNDLLMTIFGYTERISNTLWSITENTVPAGPYQVPIVEDYSGRSPRMDVDDSTHTILKANITSSATSFVIKTDASSSRKVKKWVDSTNYPAEVGGGSTIDINIGGERITVSDIGTATLSGGYNEQTVTVSARAVNGVTLAHSAGDSVELWSPYYLGME